MMELNTNLHPNQKKPGHPHYQSNLQVHVDRIKEAHNTNPSIYKQNIASALFLL